MTCMCIVSMYVCVCIYAVDLMYVAGIYTYTIFSEAMQA